MKILKSEGKIVNVCVENEILLYVYECETLKGNLQKDKKKIKWRPLDSLNVKVENYGIVNETCMTEVLKILQLLHYILYNVLLNNYTNK